MPPKGKKEVSTMKKATFKKVGRRTLKPIKIGKNIRVDEDGFDNIEDYLTGCLSESDSSLNITIPRSLRSKRNVSQTTSGSESSIGSVVSQLDKKTLRVKKIAIGRRTLKPIREGKNIRKNAGGFEIFDDYFTDADLSTSAFCISSASINIPSTASEATEVLELENPKFSPSNHKSVHSENDGGVEDDLRIFEIESQQVSHDMITPVADKSFTMCLSKSEDNETTLSNSRFEDATPSNSVGKDRKISISDSVSKDRKISISDSVSKDRNTPISDSVSKDRNTPIPDSVSKDRNTPIPDSVCKDRNTPIPDSVSKDRNTPIPDSVSKDRNTPIPDSVSKKKNTVLCNSVCETEDTIFADSHIDRNNGSITRSVSVNKSTENKHKKATMTVIVDDDEVSCVKNVGRDGFEVGDREYIQDVALVGEEFDGSLNYVYNKSRRQSQFDQTKLSQTITAMVSYIPGADLTCEDDEERFTDEGENVIVTKNIMQHSGINAAGGVTGSITKHDEKKKNSPINTFKTKKRLSYSGEESVVQDNVNQSKRDKTDNRSVLETVDENQPLHSVSQDNIVTEKENHYIIDDDDTENKFQLDDIPRKVTRRGRSLESKKERMQEIRKSDVNSYNISSSAVDKIYQNLQQTAKGVENKQKSDSTLKTSMEDLNQSKCNKWPRIDNKNSKKENISDLILRDRSLSDTSKHSTQTNRISSLNSQNMEDYFIISDREDSCDLESEKNTRVSQNHTNNNSRTNSKNKNSTVMQNNRLMVDVHSENMLTNKTATSDHMSENGSSSEDNQNLQKTIADKNTSTSGLPTGSSIKNCKITKETETNTTPVDFTEKSLRKRSSNKGDVEFIEKLKRLSCEKENLSTVSNDSVINVKARRRRTVVIDDMSISNVGIDSMNIHPDIVLIHGGLDVDEDVPLVANDVESTRIDCNLNKIEIDTPKSGFSFHTRRCRSHQIGSLHRTAVEKSLFKEQTHDVTGSKILATTTATLNEDAAMSPPMIISTENSPALASCLLQPGSESIQKRNPRRVTIVESDTEPEVCKVNQETFSDLTESIHHYCDVTDHESPQLYTKSAKSKIIHPEPAPKGLRRSQRTRVQRLETYKNERIVYDNRRKSGVHIMSIQPSNEAKYLAHSEKLAKARKKRNRMKKAKLERKKNGRNLSIHGQFPEDLNMTFGNEIPIVNPETQKEVLMCCLSQQDGLVFVGPNGNSPKSSDPFVMSKSLNQKSFFTGELILRPLSEKPLQRVISSTLILRVIYGKLAVTIHRKVSMIETGDSVFIPPGSVYKVRNLRNEEAKLYFVNLIKSEDSESEIETESNPSDTENRV